MSELHNSEKYLVLLLGNRGDNHVYHGVNVFDLTEMSYGVRKDLPKHILSEMEELVRLEEVEKLKQKLRDLGEDI